MLKNRCKLKYKLQEVKGQTSVIVDYFNVGPRKNEIRYELFNKLIGDRGFIIEVNTSLILSNERLEPKVFIDNLLEQIKAYDLKYIINRMNGEVYRMGLGRLFNMKQTVTGVAYKVAYYVPTRLLSTKLFDDLLATYDVKCFVCQEVIDINKTMELFYSGMIEESDQSSLFELNFYDNVNIEQMIIKPHGDYREKVVQAVENVKESCK